VFPLWSESRALETELDNIRHEAGVKVDALMILDHARQGLH
jgi:hypothetical protein